MQWKSHLLSLTGVEVKASVLEDNNYTGFQVMENFYLDKMNKNIN
jgi:hypothetical protein